MLLYDWQNHDCFESPPGRLDSWPGIEHRLEGAKLLFMHRAQHVCAFRCGQASDDSGLMWNQQCLLLVTKVSKSKVTVLHG